MNRETRQFVFGLICIVLCGYELGIDIAKIINGTWKGGMDYLFLMSNLIGLFFGSYYVFKNI